MKRPRYPMPPDVEQALKRRLTGAYGEQPSYQQNDYVGWIGRAKLAETRQARIDQMLDELQRGGVYVGIAHNPSRRDRAPQRLAPTGRFSRMVGLPETTRILKCRFG
jgi:hypothetical protein